jgi:hypothetical protein
MSYITIRAGFTASGREAGLLLSTAWHFKLATIRVLDAAKSMDVLPGSKIGWKSVFRGLAYDAIPNRRYADAAVIVVMGIYESCRQLGVDFRSVELGDWLMFQQSEKEYPPRNITLKSPVTTAVTVFGYRGERERITLRITASNKYRELLEALLKERQPYNPRIVVKSWNIRNGKLYVNGELQVSIPLDFYYKYVAKYKENQGQLYAGVDVNADRINLAIVGVGSELRDVKTFWFREVTARGYPGRRAWSVIGMRVHEMLRYAYHHGVSMLFLESPEVLGRLRLVWIRNGRRLHSNYNWKVATFRSRIIEMITRKAPLYAIRVAYVDPRGTTHSREHDKAMKRYGVDRHTASAYMIALKGLNQP